MNKQKGLGLIEVLVSLLIIAVGVLGVVTMQSTTLAMGVENYTFNQANTAVNDLYERIRSNQKYAIENDGYVSDFDENLSRPQTSCINTKCTAEQMAAWDLYEFKNDLSNTKIPGATAQITFTDSNVSGSLSTKVTVTIRFPLIKETSTTASGESYEQFVFETRV